MSEQHSPDSSRSSKPGRSAPKKPDGFNWSLDQELREKESFNHKIFKGGDIEKGSLSSLLFSSSSPPTPSSSSSLPSSPPAVQADPDTVKEIIEWFEACHISGINYLLRHYTVAQLDKAADDYERVIASGVKVRNPGGYFYSLLK